MSKSCELGLAICKEKVVSNSSSGKFSIRALSTGLALRIEPVTGTAGQHSTNYMYMHLLQGNTLAFSGSSVGCYMNLYQFCISAKFYFFYYQLY